MKVPHAGGRRMVDAGIDEVERISAWRIKTPLLLPLLSAEIHCARRCARGDEKRAQFTQRKPKHEARKPLNQFTDSEAYGLHVKVRKPQFRSF